MALLSFIAAFTQTTVSAENGNFWKKLQIPQFASLPGIVVPRGIIHVTATADSGSWIGAGDGSRWIRAGSGSGGVSGWSLTGNMATSSDFIGTTTNEDLVLKRYGTQVGRLQYNRTSVGAFAGDSSNSIGQNNYGFKAGVKADNAPYLSAQGYYSGYRAKNAAYATYVGPWAGDSAVNGWYQTGIGHSALAFADSAYYSTGVGTMAGFDARQANYSTLIGAYAGYTSINAQYALMAGAYAGYGSPNLQYSTILGPHAGKSTTGKYDIYIGYKAGTGFSFNDPQDNNIVIGNNISLGDSISNTADIGNALYIKNIQPDMDADDPVVSAIDSARVGINTAAPHASTQLDLGGIKGGLGLPRLTTTQRDALPTPNQGVVIFNTTVDATQTWNGVGWETSQGPSTAELVAGTGITITSGGGLEGRIFGTEDVVITLTGSPAAEISHQQKLNPSDDSLTTSNVWYIIDSVEVTAGTHQVTAPVQWLANSMLSRVDFKLYSSDSVYMGARGATPSGSNYTELTTLQALVEVSTTKKIYLAGRRTDSAGVSVVRGVLTFDGGSVYSTRILTIQLD